MTTFSKAEVIQRVSHYLEPHQSAEMTIEIVERLVRTDGDWWYVPVHPTTHNPITYSYFGVLTDIEGELKQNEHLDVLLVPSA